MRTTLPHHGKRLQRLLTEQARTQIWLADQLDVTRQQITKWVQLRSWQPKTTEKVARALGVPSQYFYEQNGDAR